MCVCVCLHVTVHVLCVCVSALVRLYTYVPPHRVLTEGISRDRLSRKRISRARHVIYLQSSADASVFVFGFFFFRKRFLVASAV